MKNNYRPRLKKAEKVVISMAYWNWAAKERKAQDAKKAEAKKAN